MNRLNTMLDDLQRVPVERLGECALMRRVDTKFLYPAAELDSFIRTLGGSYGVLPAGGSNIASYRTLYFDSPDKTFYHQHRRGRRDRFKVRVRHYLDRELTYLEVKRKTNHNVTVKKRLRLGFLEVGLGGSEAEFLRDHLPGDPFVIRPAIWTNFSRITLVSANDRERLTVDLGLEFEAGRRRHRVEGLAIVEVKQPRFRPRSPAMLVLRERGIRPSGMSKYCTAQAILSPGLRRNRFHRVLRTIGRIGHV
ncbi:MAG: polyphosphate polymerase domain-containing protein [bacterium]|nr:polyphosphate polymerase domain-containing protein [bacterium]